MSTEIAHIFDFIPAAAHASILARTSQDEFSTEIIQAIAGCGGKLNWADGKYNVAQTIPLSSHLSMSGVYGEQYGVTDSGTMLNWVGSESGIIVSAVSARLLEFDGFHLNAGGIAGVRGILLDSDNNPSGSQNEFRKFSIYGCLTGVQWGTSGISSGAYANDGTRFSTFTIWSDVPDSRGFVINSGNAGQMSTIESGGIQTMAVGIDIEVANLLQIRRVFGGGVMDEAFIRASTAIDVLIEGCSSECWGIGRTWRTNRPKFLKVIAPQENYPIIETTITLQQNQINNHIWVDYPIRLTSIGDAWGYCKEYITGADMPATGDFTNSTGAPGKSRCVAISNGVNPASINLTSNEPAMGWIDGNSVNLSLMDPGRGWVAPAFDISNFSASGSMVWSVDPSDVQTYAYHLDGRTMTVSFKINNSSICGQPDYLLRMKIPAGKVASRSMLIPAYIIDNVGIKSAFCTVEPGSRYIEIQPIDLSRLSLTTNRTTVVGQITFEID